MKNIEAALSAFPAKKSIPVQWGDMDSAQHVNNTEYLRWAETSRMTYFEVLGYEVTPGDGKAGFILGWQDCKYIFPVTYPDTIHMGIRMTEMGADRFTLETQMFSERHDRLVAISKQVVVTYDYTALKKMAVPDELKKRMREVEGEVY